MTTTNGQGIVFLQETDPITPFHTLINTLQTGTSNAVATRVTRTSMTPAVAQSTSLVTITAGQETAALVTVNFTLDAYSRLFIFAESHIVPSGNASGEMRIKSNGTTLFSRSWHSRSSSSHQWPSLGRWWDFGAGSYSITMTGTLDAGSLSTSYDHPYLSVGAS